MSSILPFASSPHPVWSPVANKIHAAVWDDLELAKVQEFVRQWAEDWIARYNSALAAVQKKAPIAEQVLENWSESLGINQRHCLSLLPEYLYESIWQPERPELPLPPSHRPRSLAEKWAALAAVHDVFDFSGEKILPWPLPEDEQDLVAFADWMRGEGGAYLALMRAASELTDTEADPVGRWLEDVKQAGDTAADQGGTRDDPNFRHSEDFRSVVWFGTSYTFTKNQAACVKVLWDAWKAGTPELEGLTVVTLVEVSQDRLIDVFRSKRKMHAAWGTMITQGQSKGAYRLNDRPVVAPTKARGKGSRKTTRKTHR